MIKNDIILQQKNLSAWLRGVASKHDGDFYCLNCLHSYITENNLRKHYNVRKNHDCCCVEMSNEDNRILEYNHGEKSRKVPCITYIDLEILLEKMSTCHNNSKTSATNKINKPSDTPSAYPLFTQFSFDAAKIRLIVIEVKIVWRF